MEHNSPVGRLIQTTAPVLARFTPGIASYALATLFTTPLGRPVHKRALPTMERATHQTVAIRGWQLPLYSWGEGPTVLLVHGWSGRASQLVGYVEPLVEAGFRVVAFDGPAHGEAAGRSSSLPELARAVEGVGGHLGPLTGVVAHSLGAAATTLALSRGMAVERVVYVGSPEDLPAYLRRLSGFLGFGDAVAERAQRRLEAGFDVPFEEARGSHLAPGRTEPLLAFHDVDDREVPLADAEALSQLWAGAQLVVTKGLGHHRILRDPAVVRQAVAFLSES